MVLAEAASSFPLCNLVAALFRLENSPEPTDVQRVLQALADWLSSLSDDAVRRAFLIWLKCVLLPGRLPGVGVPEAQTLEEMQAMVAEQVREWTRQWKEEGRKEGRLEGREKAVAKRQALANDRALLLRLARQRFAEATVQTLAVVLDTIDVPERLVTIGEAIVECATDEEFLARVQSQDMGEDERGPAAR